MAEVVDILNETDKALKIVNDELADLAKRIIANHDRAGQRATGKTAESFEVVKIDGLHVQLQARPFIGALETGSQPWKGVNPAPTRPFHEIIEEWATAKGIVPDNGDMESFAQAVAHKIMSKGTKLFREGGRKDIITPEVEKTTQTINEKLAEFYGAAIQDIVGEQMRQAITEYKALGFNSWL